MSTADSFDLRTDLKHYLKSLAPVEHESRRRTRKIQGRNLCILHTLMLISLSFAVLYQTSGTLIVEIMAASTNEASGVDKFKSQGES
jgi:hypothetical protein